MKSVFRCVLLWFVVCFVAACDRFDYALPEPLLDGLTIENLENLNYAQLKYISDGGYLLDYEAIGLIAPAGTVATLCFSASPRCEKGTQVYPNETVLPYDSFTLLEREYRIIFTNPAYSDVVISEPFAFPLDEVNESIVPFFASNGEPGDYFSWAIAISGDGNTLIAASKMEDSISLKNNELEEDNTGTNTGALYVFSKNGKQWTQVAYLKKWYSGNFDELGFSLATNYDGSIIAAGAPWDDSSSVGVNQNNNDDALDQAGAVYVFERVTDGFENDAYIKTTITAKSMMLGYSMDMSHDGVLLVGAKGANGKTGGAFVFERNNMGDWVETAQLFPSNGDSGDEFGHSVAISHDAKVAIIGAPKEQSAVANPLLADNSLESAGAAYVFRKDTAWREIHYLKAAAPNAGDRFGWGVCINGDGTRYGVGSRDDTGGEGFDGRSDLVGFEESGSLAVYKNGVLDAYLKSPGPSSGARFGMSCDFDDAGEFVAVAERSGFVGEGYSVDYSSEVPSTGSVSLYDLQKRKIHSVMSLNYEENTAGYFRAVEFSADGGDLLVSEYEEGEVGGHAYLYSVR